MVVITGSNFRLAQKSSSVARLPQCRTEQPQPDHLHYSAHFPAVVDVRVENPSDSYGTLLNAFTFESTAAQVSMPLTGGGQGIL